MRSHVRTILVLAVAALLLVLFLHNVDLRGVVSADRARAAGVAGAVARHDVREPGDPRLALAVPARAARRDHLRERFSRDGGRICGEQHAAGARRRGDSALLPRRGTSG